MPVPLPGTPAAPDTGARLATALLAYMAIVTAVVTLLPFEFAVPTQPRVMLSGGVVDVLANVVMFVPLGFLYAVSRADSPTRASRIFLVGLAASAAIETLQLFEVSRYVALSDVLANGTGAYLGAVMQRRLARRISMDARTVGKLSLELPVMGLVYLLVPLLWLDGLAGTGSSTTVWPLLALGLFGASLLAAVQRHHFGPNRLLSRGVMAAAASLWFLVGAFPGLAPRASIVLVVMLAAVGAFVWTRSADRSGARSINRRFESRALTEAAPFYVAYLLLLVAPVAGATESTWTVSIGFAAAMGIWAGGSVLHVVELVAAFTLLGYMLAEFRGRRESRFRAGAGYVAAWAGGTAVVCEVLEGFHPDGSASLARLTLLVVAALYGAWLYHLQRAHVRRLLGRG
ncbi:MAG: VanZ family protein [Geminicoccaceae bacterium]|nr:VanZ family protein [Geminicoccaceae bacterium]